jgi:hypothetical protein
MRKIVVLTTLPKPRPAASRIALRFSRHCVACVAMSPATS